MVDSVKKFILKLSSKEREIVQEIIKNIVNNSYHTYDLKKLAGYKDLYRIRKGRIRIVFRVGSMVPEILHISNRDEQTYRRVD